MDTTTDTAALSDVNLQKSLMILLPFFLLGQVRTQDWGWMCGVGRTLILFQVIPTLHRRLHLHAGVLGG